MGCLRFTAHTGERYYAECTMAGGKTERFDLPASNNLACVLRVLQTERDFTVMVQSGRPLPKGLRLLVHCRGNLCYFREWNDDLPSLIFERDKLPGGVLQILLAGQGGQCALRASGLQSGRRTCDDRRTNRRHTRTTHEGHARRHGDRSRRRSCRGRFLDCGDGSRGGACGDVGQHLLDAAAELRTAGYDRDARLVLRGAGRRTGRGARRTAAHAGVAALRRAGRGTGRVCDAGLPARSRAGDRGADQQGRTVEQEEEARPLRDADDRAAVALLVAGADRQRGTVRAQRLRLPRQHALRAAARGGEGACCRRRR